MVAVSVIRALVALNLGLAVAASYVPRAPAGTQFITGACTSDADCASSCCGFHSGKCAGAVIAQTRDGGCGFGDAQPNNKAAQAIQGANAILPGGKGNGVANGDSAPAAGAAAASGAAASSGAATTAAAAPAAKGTQFITGPCSSDADCANGCCGFNSGKCAGAVVAQERDGGCGHGDAQPNDNAAKALAARALAGLL